MSKLETICLISIIIIVVVFGILVFTLKPGTCIEEPYNYKCYCPEGYVKTGFFPWKCEKLPELPENVSFPIETWDEALLYVESLMGGFKCEGNYQYDNPLTGQIYKQCNKYGSVMTTSDGIHDNIYSGHIVMIECRSIEGVDESGQPVSGNIVFSVRFDPNDGWVYELSCRDDLIDCPDKTFRNNWKTNPQPTCGDGCCHYGETPENCPSDCLQQ